MSGERPMAAEHEWTDLAGGRLEVNRLRPARFRAIGNEIAADLAEELLRVVKQVADLAAEAERAEYFREECDKAQAYAERLEAQLAEARETLRDAIEREEGIAETWRKEAAAIGNDAPAEMLRHRTSIQTIAGTLEQAAARLREDAGLLPGEEAKG